MIARWIALFHVLLGVEAAALAALDTYRDWATGITFRGSGDDSWGYLFGFVLPDTPSSDFVAQMVCPLWSGKGWAGMSLNQGMLNHLLLAAWPYNNQMVSTFRLTSQHAMPDVWTGSAVMKPIPSGTYTNATHMSYTFLCQNCIQNSSLTFNANATSGYQQLSWAMGRDAPESASSNARMPYHDYGQARFFLDMTKARSKDFKSIAALAEG